MVLIFTSCSKTENKNSNPKKSNEIIKTEKPKEVTAKDLIQKFKDSKMPIGDVIEYTAETDKNKFLGRPGQYIAKTDFYDTRIEKTDDNYCSIEIFNNTGDMNNRKTYLENIIKSMPTLTQYLYDNNKTLLRLSNTLSPDQASEYKNILEKQ